LRGEARGLRLDVRRALLEPGQARRELALLDEALGIAVDEPPDPLLELADLRPRRAQVIPPPRLARVR